MEKGLRDLEREWGALGFDGGFTTTRTAAALAEKHRLLRQNADNMGDRWSASEEKAVLDFVKDCTGNEFGSMGARDPAWKDLEREWEEKGFGTTRTASVLGQRY